MYLELFRYFRCSNCCKQFQMLSSWLSSFVWHRYRGCISRNRLLGQLKGAEDRRRIVWVPTKEVHTGCDSGPKERLWKLWKVFRCIQVFYRAPNSHLYSFTLSKVVVADRERMRNRHGLGWKRMAESLQDSSLDTHRIILQMVQIPRRYSESPLALVKWVVCWTWLSYTL